MVNKLKATAPLIYLDSPPLANGLPSGSGGIYIKYIHRQNR